MVYYLTTLFLLFKICVALASSPFEGEVNSNNINIRSDSTVSSQIICTVNKGERVDIVSQFYDWYKIRLPKSAPVYIKKNMVDCINQCENAKVLKDKVNLRLYPNESSPILGRVDKNELIYILKELRDWYKIEPVRNSFGWINKRFVDKVSNINKTDKANLMNKREVVN